MPWELDIAALRRSVFILSWFGSYLISRFERRILIPIPDIKAREEIFRLHVGKDHNLSDENFKLLAKMTEGFKYTLIFINTTK